MTSFVDKMVETYNYIFTDLADKRVNHWFLISSPLPIFTLTGLYLYFCTSFGPRYMKNREPYNLKNVVLLYNIFQVCISSFLLSEGIYYITSSEYKFSCDPIDYSVNPRTIRMTRAAWWYFINKIVEFLDTVFFVLRKKNNQISFLHVYHHSLMAVCMWMGVKYFNGGHGLLMGILNSFVHVVMYTYYLIAGLGPQYQKYLWWKKHVTTLQLVQFVIVFIHNLYGFLNFECSYPKILHVSLMINALIFINLFGQFFIASYLKPNAKKTEKNGVTTNGSLKNGQLPEDMIKNGADLNGLATNGVAKNGTATNGAAKNGSVTNGSTKLYENGSEKNVIHTNGRYKTE